MSQFVPDATGTRLDVEAGAASGAGLVQIQSFYSFKGKIQRSFVSNLSNSSLNIETKVQKGNAGTHMDLNTGRGGGN